MRVPAFLRYFLLTCSIVLIPKSSFSRPDLVVFVRGDNNYPPYEFIDSTGKPAGFNIDLFRAIADEMKLNYSLTLGVWDSVSRQLRNGSIDMITGMFYSRQRKQDVLFSTPYLQISHALFVRAGANVKSLEDVDHRNVLVQQGDIMHEFLIHSVPEAHAIAVRDPVEVLRRLEGKEYDCALLAHLQGTYLINRHDIKGVDVRPVSLPPRDYCFAVKENNKELLTALNEGLSILKGNGKYREIYTRWFGVTGQDDSFETVAWYAGIILIILIVILSIIVFWNVTLRKTVRQHTRRLEQELKHRHQAEKIALEKEQHLSLVADNMPVLIAHIDAEETYLYVNRSYSMLTGQSPEQIIGKKVSEIVDRDYYLKVKPYVDRALAGERVSFGFETKIHTGEMRYLQKTFVPSHDNGSNHRASYFALTQDVTEYIQTANALRESETNLSITLHSIGDAVIATDASQRITRMNPIAEQLTGWTFEEAQGMYLPEVFKIINADSRKTVESPAQKVLHEGRIVGLANHTILVARDGTERQIADSGAPIRNQDKEIVGVVLVFRDVTESYMMEAQLRQAQKMDAIGQLAGGIAHDFNNQLAGIMGYADLMHDLVEADSGLRRYSESIIRSVERAADLTSKLLAFARKGKYQSVPVNLHSLISEVISMLEHTIDRRISIRQHLDAAPATTLGDPSQLQNALLNIAINARDAMPAGGEIIFQTANVDLTDAECNETGFRICSGSYVHVRILDTGCGIDNAIVSRIFEPFFTTKEQGNGTGMGLAAVYGTMKTHNGAVTVESTIGEGTAFNLFLPVHQMVGGQKKRETGSIIHGSGTVLMVDDEAIVCKMAAEMLQELGYTVIEMHDGKQASEYYNEHHGEIDLVILDLVMPKMSGVDTYFKLREIDDGLTVLVSSGFSIDGEAQKILAYERSSFIQKPFRKAALSQAVAKALSEEV